VGGERKRGEEDSPQRHRGHRGRGRGEGEKRIHHRGTEDTEEEGEERGRRGFTTEAQRTRRKRERRGKEGRRREERRREEEKKRREKKREK
jgi:hypothetical protein